MTLNNSEKLMRYADKKRIILNLKFGKSLVCFILFYLLFYFIYYFISFIFGNCRSTVCKKIKDNHK